MFQILRNMAQRPVRTGLTVFGIAIGVFALTVMGAMSEKFASLLDGAERLSSRNIQIQPATRSVDDRIDRTTIAHLKQVDGVEAVVTTLGGILADGDNNVSFGPTNEVFGIDPAYIPDVLGSVQLQAGRWLDASDFRATVVGSKVATSYGLGIGSTLTWRKNDYTVVGIMGETDTYPDNFAVMPEDTVRRDLKFPSTAIGSLTVIPDPLLDPEVVASRINADVAKVRAQSPRQVVEQIRQSLALFDIIMLGGAVLAGIVGGLAVVNTMIMSVNERTREIGIKKALGAEDSTIVREFLTEAALIGVIGGVAGAWAGWVTASLLNVVLAGSIGGANVWLVTPRLIAVVLAFALALGLGAGIYPAWSAARLDPVQALRSE